MSGPSLTSASPPEVHPSMGFVAAPRRIPPSEPRGPHQPQGHSHIPKPGILPAVQSLIVIIVVAVFIVTFTVQPFRIPSGSMEPTLLIGDFLFVDKQVTADSIGSLFLPPPSIHRGDVIVFHFPLHPDVHLVKRVVGIPGDHLRLRNGHVLVNGLRLDEPYAFYRPSGPDNFRDNFPRLQNADPAIDSRWWIRMRKLIDDGGLIVPAGNYFVLGDNRNNSEDSRYWGFVPSENIVGRPLMIYFSLRQGDGSGYISARPAGVALQPSNQAGPLRFARWERIFRIVR
ncbi:signal peptidase I [Edaphobacter modestus]|uniref:Signal peptidase I n=1 Tax=Edaphobacter modestus TaxID=388466 RepID=A0A4Q7YYR5_9BACT|nr:signal peptidase I [Edaphobacter modestus]RZU42325.1 signal peptidase I [Edaphobacter modestus]